MLIKKEKKRKKGGGGGGGGGGKIKENDKVCAVVCALDIINHPSSQTKGMVSEYFIISLFRPSQYARPILNSLDMN